MDKIKITMESIDANTFNCAVDIILNAKNIYVLGIRSCAPLAGFLSFYLNLIFDNVRLLQTNNTSEIFEQMVRIGKQDVIIGISFPRYSMRTLKALEFANNRNAKVITLTDSVNSPMNLYSSCNLIAKSDMASIVDSLVAPLSVINALIVALCMKKQGEVIDTLSSLEKIWEDYQVYNNDEINILDNRVSLHLPGWEKEMSKILVIGGGASGMLAAICAAARGHEVHIIEKNEKFGKKIYITGKGRCNVTNDSPVEEMLQKVIRMISSYTVHFTVFQVIWLWNFLKMRGAGLKWSVETGFFQFQIMHLT